MKKPLKILVKGIVWLSGILIFILIIVTLLLRLPVVQTKVTQWAAAKVSSRTKTVFTVDKLYIGFPGSIMVEGVFAEDLSHDTLIYLRHLEADIEWLSLLDKKVEIDELIVEGLQANIKRSLPDSSFNFDFISKAFASDVKTEKQPDTPASAWLVGVNNLLLENIRASYADDVSGEKMSVDLGTLDLGINDLAFDKLTFSGKELLLKDASISIIKTKAAPDIIADTLASVFPLLSLKHLVLERVHFFLEDQVSGLRVDAGAAWLQSNPEIIDLNHNLIRAKDIEMKDAHTSVVIRYDHTPTKPGQVPAPVDTSGGWRIESARVKMSDVAFTFDVSNEPELKRGMDYNHMDFSNVQMDISDALYSTERIAANIHHLSLQEKCGLDVKELKARAEYDDFHAQLSDLTLITSRSKVGTFIKASWPSIDKLVASPGELGISVKFKNSRVSYDDVLLFAPSLAEQRIFAGKKGTVVMLNGEINGKLNNAVADNLIIREGGTSIVMDARVKGLPAAGTAHYDVNLKSLISGKDQLLRWIPVAEMDLPVNLPQQIVANGKFKGTFSNFTGAFQMKSSSGDLQSSFVFEKNGQDTIYTAELESNNLDLAYLTRNVELGKVSMKAKVQGRNFMESRMSGEVHALISSITLKGHTYKAINIDASAVRGKYATTVTVKDSAIRLSLNAFASTVAGNESIRATVYVAGADLYALGLTKDKIRTSGTLSVDLRGPTANDMSGKVSLNNVLVIKNSKRYRIDSFMVATVNEKNRSTLDVYSSFVRARYRGSMKLAGIGHSLMHHTDRYFNITNDTIVVESDTSEQNFTLSLFIRQHPLINEVIFPDLEKFTGAGLSADYNNRNHELNMIINVPVLQVAGNQLTDFQAEIHSGINELTYDLTFLSFRRGNIALARTTIKGDVSKNNIGFGVNIIDSDSGNKLLATGYLSQDEALKKYKLHLSNPIVIDNETWDVHKDNFVSYAKSSGLYVNNLILSQGEQSVSLRSEGVDENAPLKLLFNKFELGTISRILEKDTAIVRGVLQGNVEIRNLKKSPAFVSDLQVSNLTYLHSTVGNLDIKADNLVENNYKAHVVLSGNGNDVDMQGTYFATREGALHADVKVGKLQLKSIEAFTQGHINHSSGYLTGALNLRGTRGRPVLNGDLGFMDAAVVIGYSKSKIKMNNAWVKIDPEGIRFNSFLINDEAGQQAKVEGDIYTTNFTSMKFNLEVIMKNFTVLNTNAEDNPLYYGKVILNSSIAIRGTESLPILKVTANLLKGTHVTVVVPSSSLSTDRGEGVVVMIDTSRHDDIMVRSDSVEVLSNLKGLDLTANVIVNSGSTFRLIVDKSSGDSLVVRGDGDLTYSIDPSGRQSLAGSYVLTDGSYKATFQKVITRDFRIKPGSAIHWSGNVLDATLDITALYRTRAYPNDLILNELGGTSVSQKNAYRKLMWFQVNLIMKGPMLRPDLTFMIEMDEKDRNAYGGMVYSKINALNSEPEELKKQVFSLLVLSKFSPTGPNNNEDLVTVNSVARSSVNAVLSEQLNSLSGKYIKDVELNVDIQTNDQYAGNSVNQQTAVVVGARKEFLNNRVSVQIGGNINVQDRRASSTSASSLTGDAVVEYKMTEDGRFRFKAFRENQYEGIIDGVLNKTGIGIMYTRDYDSLKELFSPVKREEETEIKKDK